MRRYVRLALFWSQWPAWVLWDYARVTIAVIDARYYRWHARRLFMRAARCEQLGLPGWSKKWADMGKDNLELALCQEEWVREWLREANLP